MEKEIPNEPGRQYRIMRQIWWPIRFAIKFWNPPSSSVLISRSGRRDQPIDMALAEPLTDAVIAGKRPLNVFWAMCLSVETAKIVIKDLQSAVDQIEEFNK